MSEDIAQSGNAPAFLIVGFFTPDYRHLADGLATSIRKHTDPVKVGYHFYAVPKPAGTQWHEIILKKPEIVLRAMAEHPGIPLVLMDVDCRIGGPIDGLAELVTGDVGVRYTPKMHASKNPLDWFTSRVMVIRPTEMAKLLMLNWLRICQGATVKNDETLLSVAIRVTPSVRFEIIPFEYSALEEHRIGGRAPIITHVSAHSAANVGHSFKMMLRNARRNFFARLTGRPYQDVKFRLKVT
jgi:hypothetical protein